MSRDDVVELVCEIVEDSPDKRAIAFDFDDTITWVPRSLIEDMYEHESEPSLYYVVIPEWFAEKEGLI